MARARLSRRVAIAAVVAMLLPCSAAAAAPLNDNYLASTRMLDAAGNFPTNWSDTEDVSTAITQAELFDFDAQGAPLGGGAPENTRCGAASFGNTVWYDFAPPPAGGVELTASGFDTVIGVYEYDVETAKIVKQLACFKERSGTAEDLPLPTGVLKGHAYTVQRRGVGPRPARAGGLGHPARRRAQGQVDRSFGVQDRPRRRARARRSRPPRPRAEVWVPGLAERANRERLRRRSHLIRLRTSAINRSFGLLTQWGLRRNLTALRKPDAISKLAEHGVPGVWLQSITTLLAVVDDLDPQGAAVQHELRPDPRAHELVNPI